MARAGLKQMTRTPEAKLGHFIVEFATPGIGYILKQAGCDFALFDLEHSGFGFETVKSAARYFEAAGLPAIVRVPSKEYHHIARACDAGAEGIMIPMVSTAAEAEAVANCMKYYPDGRRGVALSIAYDAYGRARSPRSLRLPTSGQRCSAKSRLLKAPKMPTGLPPSVASTACGSAISTCQYRLASPASSTIRNFSRRSSRRLRPPRSTRKHWAALYRPPRSA